VSTVYTQAAMVSGSTLLVSNAVEVHIGMP